MGLRQIHPPEIETEKLMIEFAGTTEELDEIELKQFGRMSEDRAAYMRKRIAFHQERFDKSGMDYDADWIRVYTGRLKLHGYEV
jgi:hypothetical protein